MTHPLKDYTVAPAPTFGLPADAERRSLCVGDFAKVVFELDATVLLEADESGFPPPEGERMWILVTQLLGEGRYIGKLDNNPLFANVERGTTVEFSWNNVIMVA